LSSTEAKPIRPLYFLASFPLSGSNWARRVVFLLWQMHQKNPPSEINIADADIAMPWDAKASYYQMVTGQPADTLSEQQIAAARPKVHHLLATEFPGLPIVRTQAVRGDFYDNPTINPEVTRGATYIVRNPLDVAASFVRELGMAPMKVVEMLMTRNWRISPGAATVIEPQGSWSQNVRSWTQRKDAAVLVLRFEDISTDPVRAFEKIAAHMRLEIDPEAVRPLRNVMLSQRAIEGPKDDGRDYTAFLQPHEARAIIEVHAVEMDRHGYLDKKALEYAGIERDVALALSSRHTGDAMLS